MLVHHWPRRLGPSPQGSLISVLFCSNCQPWRSCWRKAPGSHSGRSWVTPPWASFYWSFQTLVLNWEMVISPLQSKTNMHWWALWLFTQEWNARTWGPDAVSFVLISNKENVILFPNSSLSNYFQCYSLQDLRVTLWIWDANELLHLAENWLLLRPAVNGTGVPGHLTWEGWHSKLNNARGTTLKEMGGEKEGLSYDTRHNHWVQKNPKKWGDFQENSAWKLFSYIKGRTTNSPNSLSHVAAERRRCTVTDIWREIWRKCCSWSSSNCMHLSLTNGKRK